jgi:hypothetical protein
MKKPVNLEAKLDRVFSKWVRFSRAKGGYCKCVTCGKIDAPERMDAGHFVGRQYRATRWDERNVHPQCIRCNRFGEGEKDAYADFIVRTYGADVLSELVAKKHTVAKHTTEDLLELIKKYSTV